MTTVGRMVIDLALSTVGITSGVAAVEAQFAALKAQITGVTNAEFAGSDASVRLTAANDALALATNRLSVAQARLMELEASSTVTESTLLSARTRVTAATIGLANAQNVAAAAQARAAAPVRGGFPVITAAATAAGFALLLFGDRSTKVAARFEYEMRLIQTQAGATAKEVEQFSESVLELSPSVQAGPQKLAEGLFHVRSVGLQGKEAMEVLTTAAKGAAVGNADLESVTNALIATQLSGIKGVDDLSAAMGTLNGIVGTGNLRMQDLAASLSSGVLSTAKQFGLSMQDVGAAIATMADQGIPAEEAATRLRITIALIGAPTKVAEQQLAHIGLTQRSLADAMRGPDGLIGALRLLKGHMDAAGLDAVEQSQLLKTAFGGSRSSAGILTLINSLTLMDTKMRVIKEKAGSFDEDFAAEAESSKAHFANLAATIQVLEVRIGNGLLPVVTALADVFAFVGKNTLLLGTAFTFLSLSITLMATVSLAKMIIGFYKSAAAALVHLAVNHGLLASNSSLAVAFGVTSGAIETEAATMAATAVQADALVGGMTAATVATEDAAASTEGLVAGLANADVGIMTTAEVVDGLGVSLSESQVAMAAYDAELDAIVASLAGVDVAATTTETSVSGLSAGLVGAEIPIAATAASVDDLAISLETGGTAAGALATTTDAVLIPSLIGSQAALTEATIAADGLTIAETNVGIAARIAGTAGRTAWIGLLGPLGMLFLVGSIVYEKFDELAQGFLALSFVVVGANKLIIDSLMTLAGAPQIVKDALDKTQTDAQDKLAKQYLEMGDKINSEKGIHFDETTISASFAEQKRILEQNSRDLSETLINQFGTSMSGVLTAAAQAGADDMTTYAKAIRDSQHAPVEAFVALREAVANSMLPTSEIALNVGILASADLANGLASGDPAVVAAAEALKKHAVERLDELTDDAYSAGQMSAKALAAGMADAQMDLGTRHDGSINRQEHLQAQHDAWAGIAPKPDAVTAQMKRLNDQLKDMARSKAASALSSAFSDVSSVAHRFFDRLHQDNLRAIDEAVRHKNAILDAKEALNQSPVTAAQKALDFQRRKIEEWRLRSAVANATDPEAQRDAILALQDFLAQSHIDDMQAQVDAAKENIEAQKKANEDKADAAKAAEDRRYDLEVAAFDRALKLLQDNLLTQQGTWADGQGKIIALLQGYGVDYGTVGAELGDTFVLNLKDAIDAGVAALKLGDLVPSVTGLGSGEPPPTMPPPGNNTNPTKLASGSWEVMQSQLLAYVHRGEMVVPAGPAAALRDVLGSGTFGSPRGSDGGSTYAGGWGRTTAPAARSEGVLASRPGGGTVVLKVGDERLGEITDRRLSVQDDIYAVDHRLDMSSQR